MAVSSSEKEALLDALEKAIGRGVTKVKYQDKEVTYASMDDMLRARQLLRSELGLRKRPQRVQAIYVRD